MDVKKINIEKINEDIFYKASQKALNNILKSEINLKLEYLSDSAYIRIKLDSITIGYPYYYDNEKEIFIKLLSKALEHRHGCVFRENELDNSLKLFKCYQDKERINFLLSNNILGSHDTFIEDVKKHILKKYGL